MNDLTYDVDPEETQSIQLRSGDLEENVILQPIGRLMETQVGTLNPADTVMKAVAQMTDGGYGCVVIVDNDQVVGIFSERDVMTRVVAEGVDPKSAKLADYMTPNPECLEPEDEMAYALNMMVVGNFRHIPIVNENYKPIGIFSARDVQKELIGHFEKDILNLPPKPMHNGPNRRYAG